MANFLSRWFSRRSEKKPLKANYPPGTRSLCQARCGKAIAVVKEDGMWYYTAEVTLIKDYRGDLEAIVCTECWNETLKKYPESNADVV